MQNITNIKEGTGEFVREFGPIVEALEKYADLKDTVRILEDEVHDIEKLADSYEKKLELLMKELVKNAKVREDCVYSDFGSRTPIHEIDIHLRLTDDKDPIYPGFISVFKYWFNELSKENK